MLAQDAACRGYGLVTAFRYFNPFTAWARRLLCRLPALRCRTPLATTRSMMRCDSRSTLSGAVLVAGGDRLGDVLDRGAHRGAQLHVVGAEVDRLDGALLRGLDVGHELGVLKRARSLPRRPARMNLLRALATVSSLTMVSRVLGFVRDFFIARIFGAGLLTDAFFVAFQHPQPAAAAVRARAPSRRLSCRSWRSTRTGNGVEDDARADRPRRDAAVPRAGGHRGARHGRSRRSSSTSRRRASPPSRASSRSPCSCCASRFPYIVFISLVALAAGMLNTWNRFSVPALTPALLNVAFIVGALFFADYFDPPVLVLAWAVFAGGALQLAFQVPFLVRLGVLPRWRLDWRHPGVRRVLLADAAGRVRRLGEPGLAADQHRSSLPSCPPAACPGCTTPTG